MFIAIWSFAKSDLARLLAPLDDDGNFCGEDSGYEDFPRVYWPDIQSETNILLKYVCVKECPQSTDTTYECVPTSDQTTCTSAVAYNSKSYLSRICVPDLDNLGSGASQAEVEEGYKNIYKNLQLDHFFEWLNDVWRAWVCVIIALLFSFAACFLLIWILEKFVKIFVWVGIVLVFLLVFGLSTWAFFYTFTMEDGNDGKTIMRVIACIGWGIGVIFGIVLLCFCKSLSMAIAIIEAAADFVTDTL